MCDLMDKRLYSLQLTHVRLDNDFLLGITVIAFGSVLNVFCIYRNWAYFSQSIEQFSVTIKGILP